MGCSGRNCSREPASSGLALVPETVLSAVAMTSPRPRASVAQAPAPSAAELPAAAVERLAGRSAATREPCDDVPLAGQASVSLLGPGLAMVSLSGRREDLERKCGPASRQA